MGVYLYPFWILDCTDGNYTQTLIPQYNATYIKWAKEIYDSRTKLVHISFMPNGSYSSILGKTLIIPTHTGNNNLYTDDDVKIQQYPFNDSSRVMIRSNAYVVNADSLEIGVEVNIFYFTS